MAERALARGVRLASVPSPAVLGVQVQLAGRTAHVGPFSRKAVKSLLQNNIGLVIQASRI